MGKIKSYQDLLIWQKGFQIVIAVYKLVKSFNHFIDISRGSIFELETQLLLSKKLKANY